MKINEEILNEAIRDVLNYSKNVKKRNFVESIELQIGLKGYDTSKDKRFNGSVVLPHVARKNMKVCLALS